MSSVNGYQLFRADGPTAPPTDTDHLVATTSAASARDIRKTAGRTMTYVVTAVGADGAVSAASTPITISTADAMAGPRQLANDWLTRQQEEASGFRIHIDDGATTSSSLGIGGRVEDADKLAGERVGQPFVVFDSEYSADYVGTVSGCWGGLDPSGAQVRVYSTTDTDYLQGTFPLNADGTWTSGDTVIRAGSKSAVVVNATGEPVVRTGTPAGDVIAGVQIEIYSRTDVDYHQDTVPLRADGTWRSHNFIGAGEKIVRLVREHDRRILSSSEWSAANAFRGLVRSFTIPQDDPMYGYDGSDGQRRAGYRMEQRSYIYDDALAIMSYSVAGSYDKARAVLDQLVALQTSDGGLAFSYDIYMGQVFEDYRRTGALAWVGMAALEYEIHSGDTRYRPFTTRLGDYLLTLQVTEENGYEWGDDRYGSFLGGRGRYLADYSYVDEPVTFASTEHNVDAYFFYRDLGYITGDDRYVAAAAAVRRSLLTNHWNEAEGRFNQGVNDPARSLDTASWGGMFLLAVGEHSKARSSAEYLKLFRVNDATMALSGDAETYNQTYSSDAPISGYKPYADGNGYEASPELVWAEGTWGALLFRMRLGEDIAADLDSIANMQEPAGGFLQVTAARRSLPYEFVVWPSVGGTAWGQLLLEDASSLFRPDGWNELAGAQSPAFAPR